jgi:predicted DsbA family dithiol-disulfide isomerase
MTTPIRIDIVSDVVCPWCIVGYRQLEQAVAQTGIDAVVYWHPFELNPDMVPEGENLRDHIMRKYGSTAEQSAKARENLQNIGAPLGINFAFSDDARIYNTFQAHQLLHWAQEFEKSHDLKLALFNTYFEQGKDVSSPDALLDAVASVGLDRDKAAEVLKDGRFAEVVREKEQFWTSRGVSGVPTMVFDQRHATSGAQGGETFANILTHLAQARETVS